VIWIYFIPFVIVALQLYFPLIISIWAFVFRDLLPGDALPLMQAEAQGRPPPFIQMFIAMLFGAGLMEELLKASPILFGAYLSARALKNPPFANNQMYRWMHVQGPLDGALMGIFAGGAFVFIETGFQYVPNMVRAAAGNAPVDPRVIGTQIGIGFGLLFPRAFGGLVGHMAWAGMFGYFIGLSVIRPNQRWKLLAIGYLAASVLHALWNSISLINPMLAYGVSIASAVALAAVILKGRQLEIGTGRASLETSGSIVVERPPGGPQAAPMPMAPAMAPVMPPTIPPAASPMPTAPPVTAPPTTAPPGTVPPVTALPMATAPPGAVPAEALALNIEGMMLPLRAGGRLDLGAEPALGGRGADIAGTIIPHPTRANVLGLRNEGSGGWRAKLRDGSEQTIEHDQSIRLAIGVEIQFADGLRGAVVKLG
jgi:RsiW-degrading membrane proteinase PrsW (M82 family)